MPAKTGVRDISLPDCRVRTNPKASVTAAARANKSPVKVPPVKPSLTITLTPSMVRPMAIQVTISGFSPINIHAKMAAAIGLKARMKTRLAVEVLKTASAKNTLVIE